MCFDEKTWAWYKEGLQAMQSAVLDSKHGLPEYEWNGVWHKLVGS